MSKKCSICLSVPGLFHLVQFSLIPSIFSQITGFHYFSWYIIFHCVCICLYIAVFYPLIHHWTFRVSPYLSHCEKWFNKHENRYMSLTCSFLLDIHRSKWNNCNMYCSIFSFVKPSLVYDKIPIPSNSVRGFICLYILTNMSLCHLDDSQSNIHEICFSLRS